jgi:hypothetical protein
MKQTIFKRGGKEGFFAFIELGAHDFTIDKLRILQTASIQFCQAKIATNKNAGAKSGAS